MRSRSRDVRFTLLRMFAAPRVVVAFTDLRSFRNLPRTGRKPSLDHGETIAAPKRFAIYEDPRRTEHATGNCSFAMLARDSLHLGIVYAR